MDGTACQQVGCTVCDFLPFHCDLCGQSYCSAHRSRFIHDCLPSVVKPYVASGTATSLAGADSVKQMFRDVESRHDSAQPHTSKQHFHVHRSSLQRQTVDPRLARLDATARNGTATSKQRNIANRTKAMLMKNKAVGSPSLPSEDRFYLALQFKVTGETRYFYFAPTCTIGEMIEAVCKTSSLEAFGVPYLPSDKTLVTETADSTWNYFDRTSKLSDCFESCETVKVSVIPIAHVIENQHILQSLKAPDSRKVMAVTEEPRYTPNAVYEKGEMITYIKSTDDPSQFKEFPGVIAAVHREDIELYYTVEIVVDGDRREKQTDSYHLRKVTINSVPAGAESSNHSDTLPTLGNTEGGFSIRVALGNRTTEVRDLFPDTPISDLAAHIKQWGRVDPRNKIKIICRGKTVPHTARTIKDTNITPGCKVSVMATTGGR